MDDDAIIRDSVAAELDLDPSVRASGIAVAARSGIVSLYGFCPSHADKIGAIRAAHRIEGVRGVAVDVAVRSSGDLVRGDFEIADELASVLAAKDMKAGVRITVENASITLHGCAPTDTERRDIEACARRIRGAVCVTNDLHLACDQKVVDIRERLAAALRRNPALSSAGIAVDVSGTKIKLTGTVASHILARNAEEIAWAVPGVTQVANELNVG
jgi:osmotically-inducible protein OsmY